MKLDNRLILVLVAAIGIYAIFLFISDFNIISEKISNFKINYLPLILLLVSASWVPLIIRWHFTQKLRNTNTLYKIYSCLFIWISFTNNSRSNWRTNQSSNSKNRFQYSKNKNCTGCIS